MRSIVSIAILILVICGCSRYVGVGPSQLVCKQEEEDCTPQPGDTVTVMAGKIYRAGKVKRVFLGEHYRDVWTAPIKVPVIDLREKKGKLSPYEKGGGMQTKSLKVKGERGHLFTFRSIQKDPYKVLPSPLQGTIIEDMVQDQISAAHPYGAFVLPPLEQAIGILHTNPQLYYIPNDSTLGEFRKEFGGMLAMFEEDADEDWSHKASLGYTENAVSTETVLEHLHEDNDNEVDQMEFLKARLFDIWIGDWDRHEGQWRWAEYEKEGKGSIFKPIPEDRDNAFFRFDGVLPWLANRRWGLRHFKTFKGKLRDMAGFNYNARNIDRRFLTEPSLEEWLAMADTLKKVMTDSMIKAAFQWFPDTVYKLSGEYIINNLIVRREKITEFAECYYKILAKEVDIVGSAKHEYYEVTRLNNEETEVNMYKSSDDGEKEKLLYHRVFKEDETNEIRLYGRENKDYFVIKGRVNDGIKIRVIGGDGHDVFVDSSFVRGWPKLTRIYDTEDKIPQNTYDLSTESRNLTIRSLDINAYRYNSFDYTYIRPIPFVGYNADDGFMIGALGLFITHGFRKYPYKSWHNISFNFGTKNQDFSLEYEGDFINVFREVGINLKTQIKAPKSVTNFFGIGNDTEFSHERSEEFYNYEFDQIIVDPALTFGFINKLKLRFGPIYQFIKVRKEPDHFLTQQNANLTDEDFDPKHYAGFKFEYSASNVRGRPYDKRGVRWSGQSAFNFGLGKKIQSFSRLSSTLEFYYTIYGPIDVTLGNRLGAATNLGDYRFFHANTLGGNVLGTGGTLRGFRRDRFSGRTVFFHNIDLKIKIITFRLYVLPFDFGVTGIFDHGRVWADNTSSSTWHYSYGGGIWISPFSWIMLSATYTASKEERLININLGFTGFKF